MSTPQGPHQPYGGTPGWNAQPGYQPPAGYPQGQPSAPYPQGQPSAPYPQGQPSAPYPDPHATTDHSQGWTQPAPGYGAQQPAGYVQGGYAQQPVYGQQQASGGHAAPPPNEPKRKGGLFWALVVGVPVLLIALAIVAMMVLGQHGSSDSSTTKSTPTRSATRAANDTTTAEGAKRGFMQAIIDGDADKAITFLTDPPTDKTLLTNAVLKHLKDKGNLPTEIVSADGTGISVKLHGSNKMYFLDTQKDGDTYKVQGTSVLKGTLRSPIKIAGVPLKPGELALPIFPGEYDVENDSTLYDIGTVDPIDADPGLGGTELWFNHPQLSAEGKKTALDAAKKSLNDCLAQHKLAPAGCPYSWDKPTDGNPDESTAQATLEGDNPLDNATWSVSDDGKATTSVVLRIKMTISGTDADGKAKTWSSSQGTFMPDCSVDLNASPAKVTWST